MMAATIFFNFSVKYIPRHPGKIWVSGEFHRIVRAALEIFRTANNQYSFFRGGSIRISAGYVKATFSPSNLAMLFSCFPNMPIRRPPAVCSQSATF